MRNLKAACAAAAPCGAFMNAASPGVIAFFQPNDYYRTQDDYLEAVAAAMQSEYEAIVRRRDHPADRCSGSGDGPAHHVSRTARWRSSTPSPRATSRCSTMRCATYRRTGCGCMCAGATTKARITTTCPMERLLPIVLKAKPQGLLFEAANPRHAHEWAVFGKRRIPEDKILIPGVLSTTTNYVEHPQLVAERIERFAHIVGRERVIAGTDCGFGTFAGFGPVEPDIAYLKLHALVEGAQLASAAALGLTSRAGPHRRTS